MTWHMPHGYLHIEKTIIGATSKTGKLVERVVKVRHDSSLIRRGLRMSEINRKFTRRREPKVASPARWIGGGNAPVWIVQLT